MPIGGAPGGMGGPGPNNPNSSGNSTTGNSGGFGGFTQGKPSKPTPGQQGQGSPSGGPGAKGSNTIETSAPQRPGAGPATNQSTPTAPVQGPTLPAGAPPAGSVVIGYPSGGGGAGGPDASDGLLELLEQLLEGQASAADQGGDLGPVGLADTHSFPEFMGKPQGRIAGVIAIAAIAGAGFYLMRRGL